MAKKKWSVDMLVLILLAGFAVFVFFVVIYTMYFSGGIGKPLGYSSGKIGELRPK